MSIAPEPIDGSEPLAEAESLAEAAPVDLQEVWEPPDAAPDPEGDDAACGDPGDVDDQADDTDRQE